MKRVLIASVLAYATLFSAAEETKYGNGVLVGATNCISNVAIGDSAGHSASRSSENIIIGNRAGYSLRLSNGNIAIGNGALSSLSNVNGTVAIGENELMGADYNSDTTSINGQQLWISQPANAFSICAQKNDAFTNSPIYYANGTIHLNATNIVGKNGGPIGGGNHVSLTNATESFAEWKVLTVDNTSAVLVDNYADSPTPHKRNWASNSYQAERIYNYSSPDDAHAEFENGLFYITEAETDKGHALTTANSLRMSAEGLTVTVYGSDGNAIGTFQLTPAQ